jgi:hypothetical protein
MCRNLARGALLRPDQAQDFLPPRLGDGSQHCLHNRAMYLYGYVSVKLPNVLVLV